jgi:hypothetical protein
MRVAHFAPIARSPGQQGSKPKQELHMRIIERIPAALLALAFGNVDAATLSVGADSACTHVDLERAIAEANERAEVVEIRVARNVRHVITSDVVVDARVRVTGGFSQCHDRSALGYTRVSTQGSADARAIARSLHLDRIRLTPQDAGSGTRIASAAARSGRNAR